MNSFSQLTLFLFLSMCCCAQNNFKETLLKNNQYQLGAAAFLSTSEKLPFWLHANQYGEVPIESQFLQLSGTVKHDYDSLYNSVGKLNKFSWGYGARAVLNTGKVNQFILSEGYLKARYANFEIYAGRRKEIFGLVDTALTSGSYIWSGNALPIPKLQISIPNYTPLLKNGLISIKGGFAHGWFDEDRLYTSEIKLHQKWLYLRLGKPSWKLNLYGGGNHQAQWGGYSPFYTIEGKLPDGFQNYIHVVLGTRGSITGVTATQDFDANRIGNHLGSIDLAISINTRQGVFFLYRQSLYDDGSLFYLNNIQDGLWGLSWQKNIESQKIKKVKLLLEFLDTSNQGGSFFILHSKDGTKAVPPELRGSDQYFNNAQIKDGWVNKNKTIGTPFISVPNKKSSFNNNSLQMAHVAIIGSFDRLTILTKTSFLKSYGTTYKPQPGELSINSLLEISRSISNKSTLKISFSSSPNNIPFNSGIGTSIRYEQSL